MAVGSPDTPMIRPALVGRPRPPFLPPLPLSPVSEAPRRFVRPLLIVATVILALITGILPGYLSLIAIGAVVGLCLLLAHPDWALYGVTFAVPFESLKSVSVAGLSLTITDILIFSAAATWVGYVLLSGEVHIPTL